MALTTAEKSCNVMLIFCPCGTVIIQGVSADPHPVFSVTTLARNPDGALGRAKSVSRHCSRVGEKTEI